MADILKLRGEQLPAMINAYGKRAVNVADNLSADVYRDRHKRAALYGGLTIAAQ
jgi:hypothetical protein